MKYNKLFWIFIIIFLSINIQLVISEDSKEENYCKSLGLPDDCNIVGSGISITSPAKTLTFSSGSYVIIKDVKFENVKSGNIQLDSKGNVVSGLFSVNERGGYYNFNSTSFTAPPNSVVLLDKGGSAILTVPNNSEIGELPKSDNGNGSIVRYVGENLKFPGDHILSGKLDFYPSGEVVIASSLDSLDSDKKPIRTSIDGIYLDLDQSRIAKVFFDGKTHEGNYVSFGDKNLIISSSGNMIYTEFDKANPYVKIDSGDYVDIIVGENSGVELTDTNSELIPNLKVLGKNVEVIEDSKSVRIGQENNLYVSRIGGHDESTTSPLRISYNLEGEFKDYDFLVDNFNRMAFIPVDQENSFVGLETINTLMSARLSWNYPSLDEVKSLTGQEIQFDEAIPQGTKDMVLGRMRDYWDQLTIADQKAIKGIYIDTSEHVTKDTSGIGIAYENNQYLTFSSSEESFNYQVLVHESTHALHDALRNELIESDPELKKIQDTINRNYQMMDELYYSTYRNVETLLQNDVKKLTADELKEIEEYQQLIVATPKLIEELDQKTQEKFDFENKWLINTGKYDKVELKEVEGKKIAVYKDPDLNPDVSAYDYLYAYQGRNKFEDIAVTAEYATVLPEVFAEAINPSLDKYDTTYGPKLKNKLDYVHSIGAISDNDYNRVLKLAGFIK